jgi:hypothetical protein
MTMCWRLRLPAVELPTLLADGWPVHVIGRVVEGQGVGVLDARRAGHYPDNPWLSAFLRRASVTAAAMPRVPIKHLDIYPR